MTTLKPPFRAKNMEGLYNKVLDGKYPRLPESFTNELSKLINSLLQVQPHLRPNCDKILELPQIQKRIFRFFPKMIGSGRKAEDILLNTIIFPKDLSFLGERLPGAVYENDIES